MRLLRIATAAFLVAAAPFNSGIRAAYSFLTPTQLSLRLARSSFDSTSPTLGAVVPGVSGDQLFWWWKGHRIYSEVKLPESGSSRSPSFLFGGKPPPKPVVLLIHGFGCSTTYWRATVSALSEAGYEVHALDLLGQGRSDKPGRDDGIEYSINLWAEIVDEYARDVIVGGESGDRTVVLGGNSLGSVVALAAATGDYTVKDDSNDDDYNRVVDSSSFLSREGRVAGILMFNCGVGMNSRNIAREPQWSPAQRFLISVTLDIFDALLFKNLALLGYILDKVVTRELLRDTLQALYKHRPERVDEDLVESFYSPAKGNGAVEALSQIYTNNPGKMPMELHSIHPEKLNDLPIHLVWGDDDSITPLEGNVGQFYKSLAEREGTSVTFDVVSSGHVPFDDNPEESNASMLRWMNERICASNKERESNKQSLGLGWLVGKL